jgi:DNA-directed RNA polymerase subunit alpha
MKEPIFETKLETKDKNYAKFVISPLDQGFGVTLGNSLRRVLLTSLVGSAPVAVKISGVKHQFSTLKGMKEDVVDFVLNLKKVKFINPSGKPSKGVISAKGPCEVKAKDIKVDPGVSVSDPDLVLATLVSGAKLEAKIDIESGVGYSPAEDRPTQEIGVIPLDASFSPITRVNYKVEETRVGRFTNYDKLVLEIWTDGTIDGESALKEAVKVLIAFYNQILSPKKVKEEEKPSAGDGLGAIGKLSVEEIGLPTRVSNALIRNGYETVEDLVNAKRSDLVKIRNLGEKSLKIVDAALGERGLKISG